jgi:hypothetical protein
MPIGILHQGFTEGLESIPYGWPIVKVASVFGVLYLLKWFFNGATNYSERNMHSKVIMVTVSSGYFCMRAILIHSTGRHIRHRC